MEEEKLTEEDKLREQCEKYIELIKEQSKGAREPLNILFIGGRGVGKSSLICSIAAAFSQKKWREVVTTGHFGDKRRQMSWRVITTGKCGNPDEYPDIPLPTLIDVAGIENEYNDNWKELIKMILYGKLHEGQSFNLTMGSAHKKGVQAIVKKYGKQEERLKVDRIFFVASITEDIPTSLIRCVIDAARPFDDPTNNREIPIFGILTKYDKADTEPKAARRERDFIQALGLQGAEHRCLKMYNYCDDTDPKQERTMKNFPYIDAPILRFMSIVTEPTMRVINDDTTYEGGKRNKISRWNPFRRK